MLHNGVVTNAGELQKSVRSCQNGITAVRVGHCCATRSIFVHDADTGYGFTKFIRYDAAHLYLLGMQYRSSKQ